MAKTVKTTKMTLTTLIELMRKKAKPLKLTTPDSRKNPRKTAKAASLRAAVKRLRLKTHQKP